ncbi:MAG: mobile mystery protein A [Desulfovibrionaceae bacterium]|nr:mobile mystery protein A [Desulfovibrionaceae bacterium]
MKQLKKLKLRQMEKSLEQWRNRPLPQRPADGWIRSIRQALGMSSRFLGEQVQLTDSAVRRLEDSEKADTITLSSLKKLANGLDCDVLYALVPRQPLSDTLKQQALKVAQEQINRVQHNMAMEAQQVDLQEINQQIKELAEELQNKPRELWQ